MAFAGLPEEIVARVCQQLPPSVALLLSGTLSREYLRLDALTKIARATGLPLDESLRDTEEIRMLCCRSQPVLIRTVEPLAQMRRLRVLEVWGNGVVDVSPLAELGASLVSLQMPCVCTCGIKDERFRGPSAASLESLMPHLVRLEHLNLSGCSGVRTLGALAPLGGTLRSLSLRRTSNLDLRGGGLSDLPRLLPRLEVLELSDAGIEPQQLTSVGSLKELRVEVTDVSASKQRERLYGGYDWLTDAMAVAGLEAAEDRSMCVTDPGVYESMRGKRETLGRLILLLAYAPLSVHARRNRFKLTLHW